MASTAAVHIFTCSLVGLILPCHVFSCETSENPLLLSSYLEQNEIEKARSLSKVDRDCLEDFVPDSYTGFLTVEKQLGNHMFFWFFPASDEKGDSPLLLWLNGGPTVSSMLGLFWEHGPMAVIRKETVTKDCKEEPEYSESGYTRREYSWTERFSMLYVDNPAGVGFSFSDSGVKGHRSSEDGYTKDMVSFLKQFFQLFPEYKARDIYLGGQSYAGKYISAIAYEIHKEIVQGQSDFNLTGIYLGAPWFDPETQNLPFFEFLFTMGVISHQSLQDMKAATLQFYEKSRKGELTEADVTDYVVKSTTGYETGGSLDNIVTGERAPYAEIDLLLSRPEMKNAAHVGNREFVGVDENRAQSSKFVHDAMVVSTKSKMAELLNHYKVLIFNGDYDVAVSTPTIEAALLSTPWKFQGEYNASVRSTWRRDGEVIGFYSKTDKFCRVVIHGAGHQVPHEQPEITFAMMQQFIAEGCVRDEVSVDLASSSSSPFTAKFWSRPNLFLSVFTVLVIACIRLTA